MSGRKAKQTRRLDRRTPQTAAVMRELAEVPWPERLGRMESLRICQCPLVVGPHTETDGCRKMADSFMRWWKKQWA